MVNNLVLSLKPLSFNIKKVTIVEIIKSLSKINKLDVLEYIKSLVIMAILIQHKPFYKALNPIFNICTW